MVGSLIAVEPPSAAHAQPQAQLTMFEDTASTKLPVQGARPSQALDAPVPTVGRHLWSVLLRRTFALDVTVCVVCGGRMRLLEFATTAQAVARALRRAGLGPQPPPPARSQHSPAQLTLSLA